MVTRNTGQLWDKCFAEFNLESATLLWQSPHDPFRRVYLANGCVYKAIALQHENASRCYAQNLAGEFSILRDCKGIPGVPSVISHHENDEFGVLIMERLPGEPLSNLTINGLQLFLILVKLSVILFRISLRGISHNDVLSKNILISPKGSVSLIDFDQATRANFFVALIGQFTGFNLGTHKMYGSLITVVKEYSKKKLPPRMIQFLRRLRNFNNNKKIQELPILTDNASFQLKTLLNAWEQSQMSNANSPGQLLAYYSLDIEGYHFPGERLWSARWNMLRSVTDYSGKRILELGCNMGLLSTYLLKDCNVKAALAVDIDTKILEAAKLVAMAFDVKPALRVQDFDAPEDWESQLIDFKPDIVFALNVLNWVQDKQRLLNFLGCFQEVIFEGHDNFDTESERLHAVGFRNIKIVGISEREREVLHCRR